MTSPGGSETGSLLQGVRRLDWLLTGPGEPRARLGRDEAEGRVGDDVDPGRRREPQVRRAAGWWTPCAGGPLRPALRRRRALDQDAVLAAVGREAAEAVVEQQALGHRDRLVGPAARRRGSAPGGRAGRAWLGPVELAGQRPAVADQHDPRRRLEQDVLVLAHLRRLAHEDPARLVDPVARPRRRGPPRATAGAARRGSCPAPRRAGPGRTPAPGAAGRRARPGAGAPAAARPTPAIRTSTIGRSPEMPNRQSSGWPRRSRSERRRLGPQGSAGEDDVRRQPLVQVGVARPVP